MDSPTQANSKASWFVMRDFSQTATEFAYKRYENAGFKVFTPLVWQLVGRTNKERTLAPFIRDLFFVYGSQAALDDIVSRDPVVTYRFVKGYYHKPMVVPEADMNRFIHAVEQSKSVEYYRVNEITPEMFGKKVRIIGGKLNGYEGILIESRGGKKGKHLLITLSGFFSVGVEVSPRFISILD